MSNEELDPETEALARHAIRSFLAGNCPDCGANITERVQQGPAVYAMPCGHRMGRGNAKEQNEFFQKLKAKLNQKGSAE